MKKARTDRPPHGPKEFHTSPFGALKGVKLTAPAKTTERERPTPPPDPPPQTDENALFLQAVAGIHRLGEASPPKNRPAAPARTATTAGRTRQALPSPPEQERDELFLQEVRRLKLDARFTDSLPDEDELHPLAGNRLRQIRRGIVAVTRQLDLHGLTREEALLELPRFLRYAAAKGERAVLVITGQGNHSAGEAVLQQAVAAWLREAGREIVLEYAPAPREMGGNGAFVVFLRSALRQAVDSDEE